LAGVIFDIFTLGRIDDTLNIVQQAIYLILGVGILLLNLHYGTQSSPFKQSWLNKVWKYRTEIFHFILGSLLSAYAIFYFKSANFSSHFIFLILILLILVLNEINFFQQLGPRFKYALLMICLFSYFSFLIPIFFGSMSGFFFYLAMFLSAIVSYGIYRILVKRGFDQLKAIKETVIPSSAVLAMIVMLDFFHTIPPVPLSLESSGIYHRCEKVQAEYHCWFTRPKWKFWERGDQSYVKSTPTDKLYFFAAVFAPGNFNDQIFLHWRRKNQEGDFETSDRIPIKISGGRDEGYRILAVKENFTEGLWQVRVENRRERVIGELNFSVQIKESEHNPDFHLEIK
jgi:hypothetical protein